GLIAEEVAKVYPELVMKGADGAIETVQYYELIPLLLHEVQQQQQELTALQAQNAHQLQEIGALQAENKTLQAALIEQNAALAARVVQLEEAAARTATLAHR